MSAVDHPKHYTHPSGVECIDIVEHLSFCLGNAVKYVWRAGKKDSAATLEDLKKAQWYLVRQLDQFVATIDKPLSTKPTIVRAGAVRIIRRFLPYEPPGLLRDLTILVAAGWQSDATEFLGRALTRVAEAISVEEEAQKAAEALGVEVEAKVVGPIACPHIEQRLTHGLWCKNCRSILPSDQSAWVKPRRMAHECHNHARNSYFSCRWCIDCGERIEAAGKAIP